MTYSGMSDFEREVEEARQNNLEAEAEQQAILQEEAEQRMADEEDYIEDVSSGDKQGPTLEPTEGELENLSGEYRSDNPVEMFLNSQAIAAGGAVRNSEQYESSEDMDTQNVEDFVADPVSTLSAKGTLETIGNALGLLPWLKPVDEAIDKAIPPENDPTEKLIRDVGGLVVPSLIGGAAVSGLSNAVSSPAKLKVAAELSAKLGLDAGIAYTAGASGTDENMAQTANELFGLSLPNATTDDDLPNVRRKKHAIEAMGAFALGEALGVGLKYFNKNVLKGTDEVSEAIVQSNPQVNPDNALESAHDIVKAEREKVFTEEMARRLENGPGSVNAFGDFVKNVDVTPTQTTHDPFIHRYSEPHETYVPNAGANALETKADIAEEVFNPNYPINGRAAPLATEHFEKKFMGITEPGDRKDALDELFNTVAPSVDVIRENQVKYTAQQLNEAVDVMVDRIFDDSLSFDEFQSLVNDMRTNVYQSQNFLSEENFLLAANSFKAAFQEMFNPNSKRASALLVKDAAGQATDIARGIDLIPSKNTSLLQGKMLEKLELLASEIRANQYIAGKSLEYKKLVKNGNHPKVIEWMSQQADQFAVGLQEAKAKGLQTVQSFKEIAEKNPEYLKPFVEAVDHTNGRVDTLEKLKAYADKNIGFLKAAFNDDPEAPSWFVKGLTGVRYNAMLSGKAAINAFEGNLLGLALKPMTATLGAASQLDGGQLSKALATYGGISENFKRATKHMLEEWKFAVSNPEAAMMKGREDLIIKQLENFEVMEGMAKVWEKEGQMGKVMMWNMSKTLHGFNNSKFARYGLNAMYALDGFTNSMISSANARAKAYDELILNRGNYASKESFQEAFSQKQQEIYDQYFDANGALKQELPGSVKYQAGELEFNLDDDLASRISEMTDRHPFLKAIFAFPRTGINAIKYSWSFNPVGGVIANAAGVGKMGAVFNAKTNEQILDALKLHGINELDMNAFKALKSEYIGRQMMGGTVVTLAALWAFEGNLRGSGPANVQDRKAMEAIGWRRQTIRNPLNGKWVSYANREPYTTLLSTVADISEAFRDDTPSAMEALQKTVHALAVGPTSNSFLSGLRPVADMLSGDVGEWTRFTANTMTSQVPYSGLMGSFSRVVTPQLKDVQQDVGEYVKNRYKFLFNKNSHLVDLLDVYTGQPINYTDPITALANEVVPFFSTNTGEEDFRFKLIESGWRGMPSHQVNPFTGSKLEPQERHFINNWVAQNYPLRARVEELFDESTDVGKLAMQSLRQYRETRTVDPDNKNPIKDIFLHNRLDEIHREAFKMGFNALRKSYDEFEAIGTLRKAAKQQKEQGNIIRAQEMLNQSNEIEEVYLDKMKQDFKDNQQ